MFPVQVSVGFVQRKSYFLGENMLDFLHSVNTKVIFESKN
jgi:hypothetical protein